SLGPSDDRLDLLLQRLLAQITAVFDDDLEPAGRPEAGNRRRREDRGQRLGDLLRQQRSDPIRDCGGRHRRVVPLVEVLERDEERAEVRAVGVQGERLAGDLGDVGNARLGWISFWIRSTTAWVRSSEAASGSCTAT